MRNEVDGIGTFNVINGYAYKTGSSNSATGVLTAVMGQGEGYAMNAGNVWGWINGVAGSVGGGDVGNTGVVTNAASFHAMSKDTYYGVLGNYYGFYLDAPTNGDARYGIYLNNVSGGGVANFAIFTGTGTVSLGDTLHMRDKNIQFGTTTGTRIGTATNQKLGFYNATPVVRPSATPANATDLATALTLVNDLKSKLITLGLIA